MSQQQQQQQHQVSRELCTSCRKQVDTLASSGHNSKQQKQKQRQQEFRLFQTTMPDYAVAMVKQKLTEAAAATAQEASASGCQSEEGDGEASIGRELSRFLESGLGGAWNVIVGEDFAASVIYGANSFLHCAVGGLSYLVFSWQPVSLFDAWSTNRDRLY